MADSDDDVIPECIIQGSKDARYIQQCQDLLYQCSAVFFGGKKPRATSALSSQEQNHNLQQTRKHISWLLSCILYILMSTTSGRTLGMESLGLKFTIDSETSHNGNDHEIIRKRLQSSLFVVIPFILTVAWDLISERKIDDNLSTSVKNDFPDEGNSEIQQQYRERSRGSERLRIHQRLRQQMLDRAAISDSISTTTPDINTVNQQTRRQSESRRDDATKSEREKRLIPNPLIFLSRRLSAFIFKVYSNTDGPHTIQLSSISSSNNEENGVSGRSAPYSTVIWILRLHLANFLLTGKYPTLMHRFFGLKLRREKETNRTLEDDKLWKTILDRPNTNAAIAVLILLQASTSMVQNVSNGCAKVVAKYLESRKSADQRSKSIENKVQFTRAQFQDTLVKFLDNSSSEDFFAKGSASSTTATNSKWRKKKTYTLCTICRLERTNPAVPSSCGHVVCWNCLIQWVSKVRPECPICRAPCSANDILPLYNYEPALKGS